jgi:hypothetical protein
MKWTAERVEAVRVLAASGASMRKAATKCGVTIGTIAGIASRNHIQFGQPKPALPPPESRQFAEIVHEMATAEKNAVRDRWLSEIMPRLRANLRADVQAEVDAMAVGTHP